jgi:hypothetical protein
LESPARFDAPHRDADSAEEKLHLQQQTARIRELNDAFRRSFVGGVVEISAGAEELAPDLRARVLRRVREFDLFQDDEADEHDAGFFIINGIRFQWTIYCHNREMTGGSEEPANPRKTTRVLKISLLEEEADPPSTTGDFA